MLQESVCKMVGWAGSAPLHNVGGLGSAMALVLGNQEQCGVVTSALIPKQSVEEVSAWG